VWQHSKCLGIRQIEAEKDDFHFVCKDCKRKLEDAKKPNIKLKFRAGLSSSPPQSKENREELSPTMKFKAVELPTQQPNSIRPSNEGHYSNGPQTSPRKVANGAAPSPYLQHTASQISDGHSANRTAISPNVHQSSNSAYVNGSQHPHTVYPYQSNPPHQAHFSASHINGRAFGSFKNQPYHPQNERPVSGYGNHPFSQFGAGRPQSSFEQQHPPTVQSTPQARAPPSKNASGATHTPNPHPQGRLPSPIINRPSMSPTQGNPDVGPVAGVPHRASAEMSISPPSSHLSTSQHQNQPSATPQNHPYHFTNYMNGASNPHSAHANIHHSHSQQPLSGLSPTKHSPNLPPPAPPMAHNASPPLPHLPAVSRARSVSGTPIFPPSEMLKPSPKQLSKSPVPTPSKALTPAGVGKDELRRVSEEMMARVEEVGMSSGVGNGDEQVM
jgi:hypothetical protein